MPLKTRWFAGDVVEYYSSSQANRSPNESKSETFLKILKEMKFSKANVYIYIMYICIYVYFFLSNIW